MLLPIALRLRPAATGAFSRLLVVSAWAALSVGGLAAESNTVSFTYTFDAPLIETNRDLIQLTLRDGGQLHKLGQPAMPFRTARLLIPPGCKVEEVEAVALTQAKPIEGTWRVEYAGEPWNRPGRGKVTFTPGLNQRIYSSDDLYPAAAAELLSVQRMAGYDIAIVRVFPVQYRPASGHLVFASQLSVRLRLGPSPTSTEPPLRPPNRARAAAQVAAYVDNPELLQTLNAHAQRAQSKADSSGAGTASSPILAERPQKHGDEAVPAPLLNPPLGEAIDYLLITSSNLAAAFEPLLDRKVRDGLAVKVATIETITNGVAGCDAPEQVRNYIRQAYTNWGISYVLLGGATTVIPCRYAYVRTDLPPADSYVPCDLYYACLDGSWNSNGDRHWGEANDGENGGDVDLLAEVYVGRAPVANAEQVRAFVDKTIRAETEPNPNPTNALLLASYLGEFPTGPCQGADMFKGLLPLLDRWSLARLDDSPLKRPQWGRVEALAALNRSPAVALYNGHGTADTLMRMSGSDLARLTNAWPFLFCSVGCSAGEFDHGKFWPDSFGETLVNDSRHGAFAAILNARAGWFDPQYPWKYSGEFQLKFFDELLRRGHRNLGLALQRGKEDLIGQVEITGSMTYRWCYYGMTLLGDPHLEFHVPEATGQLSGHPAVGRLAAALAQPSKLSTPSSP